MRSEEALQIHFIERRDGPEHLLCEAEIVFDDSGPLHGLKLVGFSLWRGTNTDVYVTFPSRAFGAGTERRFFDYLRPTPVHDPQGAVARLKALILTRYEGHTQARAAEREKGTKPLPASRHRSRPRTA